MHGANGLLVYGSAGYQFDPQGNAMHLLNDNGYAVAHLAYDAWGELTWGNNPTPYGYKGQWGYYRDMKTGLLLLTHRYLDPATGRFLTRDPIGVEGGVNLYAYVGNGVVVEFDSWGLMPRGKPNPPRRIPIPTPREELYRKLFKLVKILCAVDCGVLLAKVIQAIWSCSSSAGGQSFLCCVWRGIQDLPDVIGEGCLACIMGAACNFTIPGVGFVCGFFVSSLWGGINDIMNSICNGVSPSPSAPPRCPGRGGQGGRYGPAYRCYPAY